ncbi:MAG: hypothetical protein IPG33_02640 [Betaproteobacteria bacterium]|nr:hypothetical protein [Betaproteobacteria bacterium]
MLDFKGLHRFAALPPHRGSLPRPGARALGAGGQQACACFDDALMAMENRHLAEIAGSAQCLSVWCRWPSATTSSRLSWSQLGQQKGASYVVLKDARSESSPSRAGIRPIPAATTVDFSQLPREAGRLTA